MVTVTTAWCNSSYLTNVTWRIANGHPTFYKSSPCFTSPVHVLQVHVLQVHVLQVQSMFYKSSPCFTSPVHVLQVQSIVYKSSPRSSQCFTTSCPRGIVNRVVILNTTLNKHYYVFQSTWKLSATQEVLLKVEITANIASLQPNVAVCKVIWKSVKYLLQ
jgi:hypothetical protein